MDKDTYPGVDRIGDVSDLSWQPDNSVDEVYASHILEHFSHKRTVAILKEWYRVLIPGGILKIAVPDFKRAIDIYLECGLKEWILNFLYGDQGYDGAVHYCGFDGHKLKQVLEEAGFKDIQKVDRLPGSTIDECSNIVSNLDHKSVSLNMVCKK